MLILFFLERVFVAREKAKAKDKLEKDKMQEYEREQETWNNKAAVTNTRYWRNYRFRGGGDKMQEYRRYDTFAIQQFSMGKTSRFKLFRFMLGLLVRRRLQEGQSAAARPGYGRFSKLNKIIAYWRIAKLTLAKMPLA